MLAMQCNQQLRKGVRRWEWDLLKRQNRREQRKERQQSNRVSNHSQALRCPIHRSAFGKLGAKGDCNFIGSTRLLKGVLEQESFLYWCTSHANGFKVLCCYRCRRIGHHR